MNIKILFDLISCAIILMVTHELGHFMMALLHEKVIKFEFSLEYLLNKIPIPRFIWYMPDDLELNQKKIIAISGFGFEFIYSIVFYCATHATFGILLIIFALVHLCLYNFYAGENNDFKWFRN